MSTNSPGPPESAAHLPPAAAAEMVNLPDNATYANSSSSSSVTAHTSIPRLPDADGITGTFFWSPTGSNSDLWTTPPGAGLSSVLSPASRWTSSLSSSLVVVIVPGTKTVVSTVSGAKVIVTITTTPGVHLSTAFGSATAGRGPSSTALAPAEAAAQLEGASFVVAVVVLVAVGILMVVWLVRKHWESARVRVGGGGGGGGCDVEEGKIGRCRLQGASSRKRDGGGIGIHSSCLSGSTLGGSEASGGHEGGEGGDPSDAAEDSGSTLSSSSSSSGGATPTAFSADTVVDDPPAGNRDSSSTGESSYVSAAEYSDPDNGFVHTTISEPSGSRILTNSPGTYEPGQLLVSPPPDTTASDKSVNAAVHVHWHAASSRGRESWALDGCGAAVPSWHHQPLGQSSITSSSAMSPVPAPEHTAARGDTPGCEGEDMVRDSAPQGYGSLQERLAGKYPPRWG